MVDCPASRLDRLPLHRSHCSIYEMGAMGSRGRRVGAPGIWDAARAPLPAARLRPRAAGRRLPQRAYRPRHPPLSRESSRARDNIPCMHVD